MRQQQRDVRQEAEPEAAQPATESRGGTAPDWTRARPGEELPARPDPELWDPADDDRG
jgi:hypothetical protein